MKITLDPAAKVDSLPNSLCLYFKNMTRCDRKLIAQKYFLKTLGVIPVLIESIALACLQYSCMVHVCSIVQALPGSLERLQGAWPKTIPVAMEMPICYVNFSSLNYPNLNDESLGPYG